ncbi:Crp/Fnr family transcriptional regulator [Flavobacterium defluvii]|uniref:cAMP-binding domain of CRP or a regulatory subunit of cAMP-dependent protein kinases n=1 Tax=Flavobacterium defluvii TaxID=370979 RepID=A0A1M5NBB0_9FLAO|nr:Crp/Fnr family transcriptional regulator [Flavobacterium defluvii]SHG86820.1 cAMP-binding domain of CRP or a regulatory subunit of cAMP-dependent protein kinases [Flavobacterium defluvii]
MFDKIREYLSRTVRLTEKELKIFENSLELRMVPKKTILLSAGEICNFEAYINKGCIREYFIDGNGIELTLQFATEDWWVSDITSFEDQIPSDMYIEALEDCELLVLTRQAKENLINEVPQLERMFRLMIQRHLSKLQKRLFKTVSATAMDQYIEFVTRYPMISQRVSQQYIASYLGITPEFLSRLRAKHLKNG